MTQISGVGPEAKIVADESGYKSSETPYRMDLVPARAILHLSAITKTGAESHGEQNWRNGSIAKHLNKGLVHLMAYLAGDTQDDHLGHGAWRILAALEIALAQGDGKRQVSTPAPMPNFYESIGKCVR